MNRNPKHAPPGELLRKSMNTLVFKIDRKTAKDCAFCRHSETRQVGKRFAFVCLLGHPLMDALTCPDFKDSRRPSALALVARDP